MWASASSIPRHSLMHRVKSRREVGMVSSNNFFVAATGPHARSTRLTPTAETATSITNPHVQKTPPRHDVAISPSAPLLKPRSQSAASAVREATASVGCGRAAPTSVAVTRAYNKRRMECKPSVKKTGWKSNAKRGRKKPRVEEQCKKGEREAGAAGQSRRDTR
ncbi:hypothetical protein BU14_1120s0003 [Porphyra umbilicalis]|uniref:Uncharacterized protein n=1 Tax=Porphyra umbilicalis TaxID=2786 RepID=A0A1X6NMF9_PORUM|nr:hypothetical protein BU14_1120s0003 [Porphyra umbilicalis]|eukprot:OSX69814.1 hypothetical protein BU14_1120s0003 [Porphyra umbilicalis]